MVKENRNHSGVAVISDLTLVHEPKGEQTAHIQRPDNTKWDKKHITFTVTESTGVRTHKLHVRSVIIQITVVIFGPLSTILVMIAAA